MPTSPSTYRSGNQRESIPPRGHCASPVPPHQSGEGVQDGPGSQEGQALAHPRSAKRRHLAPGHWEGVPLWRGATASL